MNSRAPGFSGLLPMRRMWTLTLGFLGIATLARAGTPPLPVISNQVFIVTNTMFAGGAYGDGASNSAAAINAAITYASGNGGGTVEIPPVGTLTNYVSGPITMASQVNLQIDSGAKLQMFPINTWSNNYGVGTTFITGSSLTDVEISGSGTIDGQGAAWWSPKAKTRPHFIDLSGCTRVLIQDVTLQNPPTFHMVLKGGNVSVTIQNITISTLASSPNTDGIQLASTNVLIQGCHIGDGDDNIVMGSGGAVTSDIMISNCTFNAGHGLSIGSSLTGQGVNNVMVTNCTFTGTEYGIHMKSDRDLGALVQNLKYLDLTMTSVNFPIAIYSYYNELGTPSSSINVSPFMASTDIVQTVTSTTPIWQNITISNLTASSVGGNIAGIIWGLPEMLVSNVTLCKVNISAPTKTFCIYNAQDIRIIDSNLTAPNTTTNTFTIYRALMTITNSAVNTNLVTLGGLASPPTNNVLAFFNAQAAITHTNMLGAGSITLSGSTLSFSQSAVSFSNNVSVVSASTLAVTSGTNTFSGALSGTGPLTVALTNSNIMLTLQGDCSGFTGTLAVTNSGTLRFNQGINAWGDANAAFDAGASGTINNRSTGDITITLGALSGGSGSKLRGSDQAGPGVDTYVIGGLNSNTTFAGTITNGTSGTSPHIVALTEIGSGTFTLSGTNSYSGGTTVSNGTLLVNNVGGSGTGTGAVTVVSGATLGGSGVIGGPVMVNGTLAPGSPDTGVGVGTLTISNSLVVNSGAVLQYALGTSSDLTAVSGDLTLGGTLDITDAGGFTNTTYTLFTYGGALTCTNVSIGTAPAGYTYTISTSTPGQVNLDVTLPLTPFQQWQTNYFGSTNNPAADPNADPDGDGQNNLAEFLSGTNPTNSLSGLRIISVVRQTTDVVITWTTAGGRTNAVQATTGDANGGYITNFADISNPINISGSGDATTNYVDVGGATNVPSRYYRVRLVP